MITGDTIFKYGRTWPSITEAWKDPYFQKCSVIEAAQNGNFIKIGNFDGKLMYPEEYKKKLQKEQEILDKMRKQELRPTSFKLNSKQQEWAIVLFILFPILCILNYGIIIWLFLFVLWLTVSP